mmetsp:Transcript_23475/g.32924  ORF Transcript_23475/g.32924 Transcript_23475/m.32924 type:complete len:275 (+) Transcript_23475:55-879(+)
MAQPQGGGSLFERVSNEILETADRAARVIDEGISIMSGNAANTDSSSGGGASENTMGGQPGVGGGGDFYMSGDEDMDMDEIAEMMGESSPLQGIAEGVIGDLMANSASQPETPWEHVQAFTSAIHWKEPFVLGLLVFQCIMFGLAMWASSKERGLVPRFAIMLMIGALVRSAEYINLYASQHWEEWGITQNYFDRQGIFVGLMFCGPLLVMCFVMLLRFLREASQLLVEVKKVEIEKQRKQKKKQQEKQNESSTGNNKKKTKNTKKGSTSKKND